MDHLPDITSGPLTPSSQSSEAMGKPPWAAPRVDVVEIATVTRNLPLPADDGLGAGAGS